MGLGKITDDFKMITVVARSGRVGFKFGVLIIEPHYYVIGSISI